MFYSRLPQYLSRAAVAFVFLCFGSWELAAPSHWIFYVPDFVARLADPTLLVRLHGAALALIGLAVLLGWWLPVTSGLAALILLEIVVGIVLVDGFSELVVRDVGLLLFTSGLWVQAMRERAAPDA